MLFVIVWGVILFWGLFTGLKKLLEMLGIK